MTEKIPQDQDHQLTADDPMIEQIEAAAEASREKAVAAHPASTTDPLEPGEPESARYEPDASQ